MIHRHRGNRRKMDARKAVRKQRIAKELYGTDWYDNLHEYSKGKVHCSCPMCASKTNAKNNRSNGPVDEGHSHKVSGTNDRYGKKNYKPSDKKRIDSMNSQLEE